MPDVERHLRDRTLILCSNREPYEHRTGTDGRVAVNRPAGGLVSALDPIMQATQGVWVAWGSGSADRATADGEGRVMVPPDEPAYALRRVFLEEEDIEHYYFGFSNRALWPLCHLLVQHFEYRGVYWERYRSVNQTFADAVADEVRRATKPAVVWVQDYHLALAPAMIRAGAEPVLVHQFWHIPFPPPDILRMLPTGVEAELLRGMLGNDLVEFHTERYALNFLGCVAEFVPEADVDATRSVVHYQGREVEVGFFPISIDVEKFEDLARAPESVARVTLLRDRHARDGRQLGLSVDRVDYTKGIPERLRALDRLWTEHPELRERFTMLVVATPSRSELPAYQALEAEMVATVADINDRFRTGSWEPIVLVHDNVSAEVLAGAYRAADLCLVSSVQDGMNLVAKEFIASSVDERGVLVLSKFAGAAEEIDDAILINPFHTGGFTDGIMRALAMPDEERRARMRRMREQLAAHTIFHWMDAILERTDEIIRARGPARVAP